MDTRFPPPPRKVNVPLYPIKAKIIGISHKSDYSSLIDTILKTLCTSRDHVLVADSASNALYSHLATYNHSQDKDIKVALPAFNCTSLVDSIISSGCVPIFLDMDENLNLTKDAVEFVVQHKCDFIIWPNYFGTRVRDVKLLNILKQHKIKIIFDEAQSFPLMYSDIEEQVNDYAHALIVSFGYNKAVAGTGGGAIYLPNKQDLLVKNDNQENFIGLNNLIKYQSKIVEQKIRWSLPRIALILTPTKVRQYTDLKILLESQPSTTFKRHEPITQINTHNALMNFRKLSKNSRHIEDYKILKNTLMSQSSYTLSYLEGIRGFPSIVALKLNVGDRHKIMELFSKKGIQVTWYYYPLSMINRYKSYVSQDDTNSYQIASTIMILPFNWHHTQKQKTAVISAIQILARSS